MENKDIQLGNVLDILYKHESSLKFLGQKSTQINKDSLSEIKEMLQNRVKSKKADLESKKKIVEHAYGFQKFREIKDININ